VVRFSIDESFQVSEKSMKISILTYWVLLALKITPVTFSGPNSCS